MTPEELKKAEGQVVRYGEHFDSNVDRYVPGEPLKTKAGKIRVHQPRYEQMRKTYYQAQCSFRGLRSAGSLDELQARLRTRDKSRDQHFEQQLRPAQELVDREHARQSAERQAAAKAAAKVREDQLWPRLSVEQKATMNAGRFLREAFGTSSSPCHLILKIDGSVRDYLEAACVGLGLEHQTVAAPSDTPRPSYGRAYWNVVGRDKAAVFEAVAAFEREAKRAKADQKAAYRERLEKIVVDASEQTGKWDITGTWKISCPELEEYFDSDRPAKLSLTIFRDLADHVDDDSDNEDKYGEDYDEEEDEEGQEDKESSGAARLPSQPAQHSEVHDRHYATFDFNLVSGIMRITGELAVGKQESCAMKFIWRGRESGENVIQLGSDERVLDLAFSQFGTKLEGRIEGDIVGPTMFTGIKVSAGNRQEGSSRDAWRDLSESNYNRECVGRWH